MEYSYSHMLCSEVHLLSLLRVLIVYLINLRHFLGMSDAS